MTPAELCDRLRHLERVDPGKPCRATELLREQDERKRRRLVVLCARAETGNDLAARMWRQLAADLEGESRVAA